MTKNEIDIIKTAIEKIEKARDELALSDLPDKAESIVANLYAEMGKAIRKLFYLIK